MRKKTVRSNLFFALFALMGLLIALWLAGATSVLTMSVLNGPAMAQSETNNTLQPQDSPAAVKRLLPTLWPLTDSIGVDALTSPGSRAPIYLDGRILFYLHAPAIEGQPTAEIRAQEIQQRLNQWAKAMLTTPADEALSTSVTIDRPSRLPVLLVEGERLLTVTNLDAQNSGYVNLNEYASTLQEIIEEALRLYQLERQPAFIRQQSRTAIGLIVVAGLLLLGSRRIGQRLRRRQHRLANTDTQLGQATVVVQPPMLEFSIGDRVDSVFALLKAQLDNRQKRKLNELAAGMLLLFQIGVCGGCVFWILALFPYSRWLTTLLRYWIKIPAKILLIAGLAYVAIRLISLIVDKAFLAIEEGAHWAPESSERLSLRLLTFSQVGKGVAGSIVFGVMVLAMLSTAGVQVGPLLAGAGIIGVGISLAAQSLIKDIINGFLILLEDHFGIGDVIAVGDVMGSVESINLRITQLRNSEGRLITIPNSQIGIVQNLSKDWSQVDLSISVAPTTDLHEALLLLKATATALSEDPQWQQSILEPPEVLGVEAIDSTGVTLRLLMKTQPLKQWPVARELRTRLKYAFDQAGISTGTPREKLEIRWDREDAVEKRTSGRDD